MEQKLRYWCGLTDKIKELRNEMNDIEKIKNKMEIEIIDEILNKGLENKSFKHRNNLIKLNNRKITQQISREYLFEQALRFFNSKKEASNFVDYIYNGRNTKNKLFLSKKKIK